MIAKWFENEHKLGKNHPCFRAFTVLWVNQKLQKDTKIEELYKKGGSKTMKVNKGAKVGILIETIALINMVLLVLMNKTIPPILIWCFVLGLAIALTGAFIDIKRK
ncbi:hypothetical protein [Anaerotignum sp. MB30-C6]|uniref:hypothetical protein n=1 Tax=Anaerotignum sp. MB30-C6 TaxID=3070814 RepID=UPI0027DBC192|nr:hypothetical protein [Anaerotignum sp. MB30-C6]WMI80527.1 hypothetical protein RBQ60_11910 [Anaerotignum sp. MB30-C6]